MYFKKNKAKIVIITILVIGIGLFISPNSRHYLLSGVVKIPSLISEMRYQASLEKRQFKEVVSVLNSEYNLVKYFDTKINRFVLYLVENIRKTYNLTSLPSEKIHYEGLIRDINTNFPFILPLYEIESDIILSKSESKSNQNLIESLESQDLTYRPLYVDALINGYISNNFDHEVCQSYYDNNFTKVKTPYSRNMISKGGNEFALIVNNNKDIYQSSLVNTKNNTVVFNLDRPLHINNFSLVFSHELGSSALIKGVNLIKDGKSFSLEKYRSYSKEGSFISKNFIVFYKPNPILNFILENKATIDAIEFNLIASHPNPVPPTFCNLINKKNH